MSGSTSAFSWQAAEVDPMRRTTGTGFLVGHLAVPIS
jgi:hypothetical protein